MSPQTLCKVQGLQIPLRPPPNPDLEKLRNEVLDSKQDDVKIANHLASQLSAIHAGYLFVGCGTSALSQICAVVSSTPSYTNVANTSSWKDLASTLGLTFHQICCIENHKYSDPTETVLKTYAQKMDSTLDKVILALCKLKRFDAITMARTHLQALEKFARREQVERTEEEDNGNHCSISGIESEEPTHDGILRPSSIRHLKFQLHITLRNLDVLPKDEISSNIKEKVEDSIQQSVVINKPLNQNRKKCSKCVMLTFANDGEKIAYNVASLLRKQRGQYLPIGVLILDENAELVEANPEQFITHYFPKMDYIISILTPRYLDSIEKTFSPDGTLSSAIDTRYVQMIHTLMVKHYVNNSCRNDKFRSVIPDIHLSTMVNDARMKRDLVLQAFVPESKIETLAMRILKKKKSEK